MGLIIASAVALVLILEGLLPFIDPGAWRRVFERALQMTDAQIRLVGLGSLVAGMLILAVLAP